jgi:hypothetical protein
MTTITRPRPRRSPHLAGSPRRPSAQLVSDGVVAAYIHDISTRHGRPRPARRLERRAGADQRSSSLRREVTAA